KFRQESGDTDEDIDNVHDDIALVRILNAISLSTNAYLEHDESSESLNVVGDTTEGALLIAAQKAGMKREDLESELPRVAELPFSSERKAMTTIHEIVSEDARRIFTETPYISLTKGAPDQLVRWATHETVPDGP